MLLQYTKILPHVTWLARDVMASCNSILPPFGSCSSLNSNGNFGARSGRLLSVVSKLVPVLWEEADMCMMELQTCHYCGLKSRIQRLVDTRRENQPEEIGSHLVLLESVMAVFSANPKGLPLKKRWEPALEGRNALWNEPQFIAASSLPGTVKRVEVE